MYLATLLVTRRVVVELFSQAGVVGWQARKAFRSFPVLSREWTRLDWAPTGCPAMQKFTFMGLFDGLGLTLMGPGLTQKWGKFTHNSWPPSPSLFLRREVRTKAFGCGASKRPSLGRCVLRE
ncbi:hypothetical protein FNV43_RR21824 [Rhamnella rubrinervis]|uniref:Uncharacterized protein n=1 Tax=Rhamnella rubrinervis TaxID=2594499 RepID=A0A8K0GQH4_9ROSA|nr:hypothetical protein FNV43_RR21824 [Rhamnella rubrinervis]